MALWGHALDVGVIGDLVKNALWGFMTAWKLTRCICVEVQFLSFYCLAKGPKKGFGAAIEYQVLISPSNKC